MSDPRDDREKILEIRDRYKAAKDGWAKIREQGDIDMRFVAGDPWEKKDRRAREGAKRPILSMDELGQYFNQTINDARQNPRAVKFTPKGNGASDASATFYQNKWRDIEYQSHASVAYITAFENCIQRSYGWTRVLTKYADEAVAHDAAPDPRFLYQDIWLEPVHNPNMVLPDPMWKRPEITPDINYLFFTEPWRVTEFKAQFGEDASKTDFSHEWVYREGLSDWIDTEKGIVLVSEYWEREKSGSRRLVILKPDQAQGETEPRAVWYPKAQDDHATIAKQLGVTTQRIHDSRLVDDYKVVCYLTNGVEILKIQPWRGRYIPFSACTGKIIYVDRGVGPQREILSMTRLAREPYQLYCYIRTLEMETMGMVTKFPYFFYEGQLSPEMLKKLADSLHKPIAGIGVKPTLPGLAPGTPLPFPQRNLLAPDLQAYEVFAEAARRAIQAAMGITPLPTAAQRKNEKSGVALKAIESQEQLGTFHFTAHYDDHIRQIGLIGEDLMDKIYDTARDVSVRDEFEAAQTVRINDPAGSQYRGKQLTGAPVFTAGDHLVTVSSGPGVESQREDLADTFQQFASDPNVMARAGDIVVRLVGKTRTVDPLIDKLADRLMPPDVKQQEAQNQQGPPDPAMLQQQIAQLGQELDARGQAIAKLTQEIQTKAREYELQAVNEQKKQEQETDRQLRLKVMDNAKAIAVARINAAKGPLDIQAEGQEERLALALSQMHEAEQAALDRTHDLNKLLVDHHATLIEQERAHQQAKDQADQAHEHALEAGAQGIAGDLASGAQQAALPPTASNGDSANA